MHTDNKTSMTKIPGTPDFMPPEALTKRPFYGPPLDIFSYGGVILNVITQQWPEPTDKMHFNDNTKNWELISEVQRRQSYINMLTRGAEDLKPLVISCLDDNVDNCPPLTQVSKEIMMLKNVCSQQAGRDGISPIVWWAEMSGQSSSQQQVSTLSVIKTHGSESHGQ